MESHWCVPSPDVLELPADGWAHIRESCRGLQTRLRERFRCPPVAERGDRQRERVSEEWWAGKREDLRLMKRDWEIKDCKEASRSELNPSVFFILKGLKASERSSFPVMKKKSNLEIKQFHPHHRQPVKSTDIFFPSCSDEKVPSSQSYWQLIMFSGHSDTEENLIFKEVENHDTHVGGCESCWSQGFCCFFFLWKAKQQKVTVKLCN